MSTEFIAAKDLPVAEGDEVDVLCVENGELKRKEGASLGGSGGGNSDGSKLIHIKFFYDGNGGYTCDHTFGEIFDIYRTGEHLMYATINNELGDIGLERGYFYVTTYYMPDDDRITFVNPGNSSSLTVSNLGGGTTVYFYDGN